MLGMRLYIHEYTLSISPPYNQLTLRITTNTRQCIISKWLAQIFIAWHQHLYHSHRNLPMPPLLSHTIIHILRCKTISNIVLTIIIIGATMIYIVFTKIGIVCYKVRKYRYSEVQRCHPICRNKRREGYILSTLCARYIYINMKQNTQL